MINGLEKFCKKLRYNQHFEAVKLQQPIFKENLKMKKEKATTMIKITPNLKKRLTAEKAWRGEAFYIVIERLLQTYKNVEKRRGEK